MSDSYKSAAVAVLHYKTVTETRDFLGSARKYYPDIRILVIDNGSLEAGEDPFSDLLSDKTTLMRTGENLGFAGGLNRGIALLRAEGWETIVCSNNDILFEDGNTIPSLAEALEDGAAGAAGPSIISLKGRDQNPLLKERPGAEEARHMTDHYSDRSIWTRYLLNRYLLSPVKRLVRRNRRYPTFAPEPGRKASDVYALNGAFFALGRSFFENYGGLDPHTFLYAEELILGEMLFRAGLKARYVPDSHVIHKEDRTTSLIYGGEDRIAPARLAQASIRHWYFEHYLKEGR